MSSAFQIPSFGELAHVLLGEHQPVLIRGLQNVRCMYHAWFMFLQKTPGNVACNQFAALANDVREPGSMRTHLGSDGLVLRLATFAFFAFAS